MNPAKCNEQDYIQFLIATPLNYSCTEAAKVSTQLESPPSHDSYTRLLNRLEPNSNKLWEEVSSHVNKEGGILKIDDSTLDKPYAKKIDLVTRHWSGKHHKVVQGINLTTLLWTDGDSYLPCDYRLYDKSNDDLTKNDHFQSMLHTAKERGFEPKAVLFDSWFSSLENLKTTRDFGWTWLTVLKSNRQVNPDNTKNQSISSIDIPSEGRVVHLKGYGFIKVFRIVETDGDTKHWATNDLSMSDLIRLSLAGQGWMIEVFHRDLKQTCGVERCQARSATSQRNHIGFAIRAFVRLERFFFKTGVSHYEAKGNIIRDAVRDYLVNPFITLAATA